MNQKTYLKIICALSLAGMLFSGYLSYTELFQQTCALGSCTNIATIPACVYGLVMYTILFILSILGLKSKTK